MNNKVMGAVYDLRMFYLYRMKHMHEQTRGIRVLNLHASYKHVIVSNRLHF